MQKDNKIFEDLAKMTSGAVGTFMDIRREIEAAVAAQLDKLLRNMNLATREECESLREMVIQLRLEQEAMKQELARLHQEKNTQP
ncbi:MAG: accessory factor UbiK family protein [Alphaproteobacteria bacterium]|nr:accessory factor UbiK family protein [Alphaproteobacteria bacterium]